MPFTRHRFLTAALLFSFGGMLLLSPAAISHAQNAPVPAGPVPTKLAVVNIVQLFEDLNEKANADSEILKMRNAFSEESQKRQKEIEDLQKALENPSFKKTSAEYKAQQDDLLKKSMDFQSFGQFAQNKLFMELRIRTADIYNKINEAVAAYSQANGIAMVFVADNINVDAAKLQEQLQAMVTLRKLVYFHPNYDITRAIRDKMNAEYGAGLRKAP